MVGYSVLIPYTFGLFLKAPQRRLRLATGPDLRGFRVRCSDGCPLFATRSAAFSIGTATADDPAMHRRIRPRFCVSLPADPKPAAFLPRLHLHWPGRQRHHAACLFAGGFHMVLRASRDGAFPDCCRRRGRSNDLASSGGVADPETWMANGLCGARTARSRRKLSVDLAAGSRVRPSKVNDSGSRPSGACIFHPDPPVSYCWSLAIFLYSISFNGVISHLSALLTDRGLALKTAAQALSILGGCGLSRPPGDRPLVG